ncbi:hypothetical protein TWF788_005852 [Orbilia oligospora]|uniref:DUF1264-domain-containing protein n=1 Tax=Orbilia oligospora TaxID=2813651 RepID=A0A7C8TW20_ORBOL|nr:hypothetical protein TWF788_005852 [Orbilia oligospora]
MASKIAGAIAGKNASTGNGPVSNVCAWLHGIHVYVNDTSRWISAHHFCSPLGEDMRQCLIFDSHEQGARLIGIEYLITEKIFSTLPESEKKLWHTHNYEVKSGILAMPQPSISPIPAAAWDVLEDAEMKELIKMYGKTYHLWQVDKHDVPMGEPQLMSTYTKEDQVPSGLRTALEKRDKELGIITAEKKERRQGIKKADTDKCDEVDQAWKKA